MQIHYEEKAGKTTYATDDADIVCPFVASRISIRFKAGTGTGSFSFDGTNDHGHISVDSDPETAYSNEVTMKTEGVSKIWLKNAGVTFAVRFWR